MSPGAAVALLIAGSAAVRLAMGWALGLGVDESYMVAAGRVVQSGYFDHPPASWWLAWAAAHIAGSEAAWVVRLPFIALFGLSTWLMFRLGAALAFPAAGLWAAVAMNLSPVFGVTTGGWVLPDGPLDCALLGAALCLAHALQSARGWGWWLGAGLCAGLALFAKYLAVLTLGGAFAYLLTQPDHRRWLARPQPYAAALLAAGAFAPVLAWNATHGWASFAFQGGRAAAASLHPWAPLVTLAGEALFLLPWIWAPLLLAGFAALRAGPSAWRGWLAVCLAAPPIVAFVVIALWSSQRVLFHWAAPGYLMLYPLLGRVIAERLDTGHRATRIWLAGTLALVLAGLLLVGTEVRLAWLPVRLDPGLQGVDWTALRPALAARGLLDADTVVGALNWQDAGKIDYALGGAVPVIVLNRDQRQFGFIRPPSAFAGRDVLIAAPGRQAAQVEAEAGGKFDAIAPLDPVTISVAGRPALRIGLFAATGLRPP